MTPSRLWILWLAACCLGGAPRVGAVPFAYITNLGDNTVSVIDTATNMVTATISVDGSPAGVAVNGTGTRIYVATSGNHLPPTGSLSVIDAATDLVANAISLSGIAPGGVANSADGARVYVADSNGSSVAVIDTASDTVIGSVTVGGLPYGVALSPDGKRLFVGNTFNGQERQPCTFSGGPIFCDLSVSMVDTSTAAEVAQFHLVNAVNGSLAGLAVDPRGTRIYVSNVSLTAGGFTETISSIDRSASTPTGISIVDIPIAAPVLAYPGAFSPVGVAVDSAGQRVYAVNRTAPTVSVIDTGSNSVVATVSIGGFGSGLSITPDRKRVYVAVITANTVVAIDTATNTVLATIPVGHAPIAFGQFIGPDNPPFTPLPTQSPTPTRTPAPCAGDCDGDGAVTVDELLQGVNIALGHLTLDHCDSLDSDHDGTVTVDEIVSAVANALNGCT